jgi:phage terminase small subunit
MAMETKRQSRTNTRRASCKSPSDRPYAADVALVHAPSGSEPPAHLSPATQIVWRRIVDEAAFIFESHHLVELSIACSALDRAVSAREEVDRSGQMVPSRYGLSVSPMIAVERESQRTALRALAALRLDAAPLDASPRRPGPRGAAH